MTIERRLARVGGPDVAEGAFHDGPVSMAEQPDRAELAARGVAGAPLNDPPEPSTRQRRCASLGAPSDPEDPDKVVSIRASWPLVTPQVTELGQ